ncbi:hypothetical protein BSQ40_25895 [Serratia fonticola]|nr:hypothetical protein BSQ40_25895 [Serratia fonticola]
MVSRPQKETIQSPNHERAAQGDRNKSVIVRWGVWGVIAVCGKNPIRRGGCEAVSNAPVTAANPVTDVQAPDTQGIITQ